jgi:AcrR family transcriptional regulator
MTSNTAFERFLFSQREERRKQFRETVLERARVMFLEHGYDGASLRKMAADLRLNSTSIANHFGSKAGLWKAIFGEASEQRLGDEIVFLRSTAPGAGVMLAFLPDGGVEAQIFLGEGRTARATGTTATEALIQLRQDIETATHASGGEDD